MDIVFGYDFLYCGNTIFSSKTNSKEIIQEVDTNQFEKEPL
jgi:hypothetical protein